MATTNAFITTWVGDDYTFDVLVNDTAGVLVNISGATEITWVMATGESASASITKTKTGGGITLPGGGTDGVFRVALVPGDTSGLTAGVYYQEAFTNLSTGIKNVIIGTVWLRAKVPA
jgi:hypothetical protein